MHCGEHFQSISFKLFTLDKIDKVHETGFLTLFNARIQLLRQSIASF